GRGLAEDLVVDALGAALAPVRLAPGAQPHDPVVQPLAATAQRLLPGLVGPGDVTVERHADGEAQSRQASSSLASRPAPTPCRKAPRRVVQRLPCPRSGRRSRVGHDTSVAAPRRRLTKGNACSRVCSELVQGLSKLLEGSTPWEPSGTSRCCS